VSSDAELKSRLTLRDEASKNMKGAERSLVSSAAKIAAGFLATGLAVQKLNAFVRDSVKASLEHETAIRKLETAGIRNVHAINTQAEAMQRQLGISSDVILTYAAMGRNAGLAEDKILKLVQAGIDLDAALGGGVEARTRQLIKSLGGLAGELGEVDADFKSFTKTQLQAGAAIDLVTKKFGGQGSKQADTLTGAMNTLHESVGDFKRAFGDGIIGVITGKGGPQGLSDLALLIDSISRGVDKFPKFDPIMPDGSPPPRSLVQNLIQGRVEGERQKQEDELSASRFSLGARGQSAAAAAEAATEKRTKADEAAAEAARTLAEEFGIVRRRVASMDPGREPGRGLADIELPFDHRRAVDPMKRNGYVDPLTDSITDGFDRATQMSSMFFDSLSRGFIDVLSSIFGGDGSNWLVNFSRSLIEAGGAVITRGLLPGGGNASSSSTIDSSFSTRQQARSIGPELERARIRGQVRL
jgi:hypothetical protein